MHVVYETLRKLGVEDKPIITAFNKQDKIEEVGIIKDFRADEIVKISAKEGQGLDTLLEILEKELQNMKVLIEKTFAYSEAGRIQSIRKYGQMLVEEYRQDGIYVKAYVPKSLNI